MQHFLPYGNLLTLLWISLKGIWLYQYFPVPSFHSFPQNSEKNCTKLGHIILTATWASCTAKWFMLFMCRPYSQVLNWSFVDSSYKRRVISVFSNIAITWLVSADLSHTFFIFPDYCAIPDFSTFSMQCHQYSFMGLGGGQNFIRRGSGRAPWPTTSAGAAEDDWNNH